MSIAYCKPYVVLHIAPPRTLVKTALSKKCPKILMMIVVIFMDLDIQPLVSSELVSD